jgi:hypothetical protein
MGTINHDGKAEIGSLVKIDTSAGLPSVFRYRRPP